LPFERGDCGDYRTWLAADRGIKDEQTTIGGSQQRLISQMLCHRPAGATRESQFDKRGNVYIPVNGSTEHSSRMVSLDPDPSLDVPPPPKAICSENRTERSPLAIATATTIATLTAIPFALVYSLSTQSAQEQSPLSWSETDRCLDFALNALIPLLVASVVYTIIQELIVLRGLSMRRRPSPVTLLLCLVSFSSLLGGLFIRAADMDAFGQGKKKLEFIKLLVEIIWLSYFLSAGIVPAALLRYAMSMLRCWAAPLVYYTGLLCLTLWLWALISAGWLEKVSLVGLCGLIGFFSGGMGQLLILPPGKGSGRWAGEERWLVNIPSQADEADEYTCEVSTAWSKLWVTANVVLFVEGVIAIACVVIYVGQSGGHLPGGMFYTIVVVSLIFAVAANIGLAFGLITDFHIHRDLGIQLGRGRYLLFGVILLSAMYVIYWCTTVF
jgi:hypothetical protein